VRVCRRSRWGGCCAAAATAAMTTPFSGRMETSTLPMIDLWHMTCYGLSHPEPYSDPVEIITARYRQRPPFIPLTPISW